ncbi:glycoside hydrolase family 3 C-terminal domain-containing protein [Actinoallomurus sp. NPDC052308]|uniref:glycoside hydrolase family 3 C-terminal domain-containing protein n=1 Tax=Actinoallomurus sp. NPDC052308 TaxID=3155530 RepID=UPI0034318194
MTLDEKLSFVSAQVDPKGLGEAGYIPGVPRLGIPELRLTDGPAGVRVNHHATALPAPVTLASTWDPRLARDYGQVIGRDGRALDQDVQLAPMTNIIRVPQGGRNFETFSEDPLVSSHMVANEITGIQSQGLIATVKHYAENNQEDDRMGVDVNVDAQTMHEIELPAFQAAVQAGVGALMCSYNSVNGKHGCGNDDLLNGILKTQWAFRGWVMSDWGATHATTDLVAGLDQDMFTAGLQPDPYFQGALKQAITDGSIPVAALDDAVARILGQMERFGLLDGAAEHRPARDPKGGAKVAQRVAESGAVLLKNAGGALPLTASDNRIAIIGPSAKTPKVGGGGSSSVTPDAATSPLDAITRRAGARASITYAAGGDTTGVALPLADSPLGSDGTLTLPAGAYKTARSTITVPATGDYIFTVNAPGSYGSVTVDGAKVADTAYGTVSASAHLTAGTHTIDLFATVLQGAPATLRFTWVTPDMVTAARNQAVAVAKKVRTPIVFAYDDLTEGTDRTGLSLPFSQDELISAVADANPNTIVVLNTGSSITMPWLSKVKAVLDTYYPGENGAEATARLLYGDVNPSGKLTQTFPTSASATPVAGDPKAYPGVDHQETYKEGIFVGYRWYDKTGTTPLFPFGYGLSYTSFAYGDLRVRASHGGLTVSFTLKNTGHRDGQEVAQVYVGAGPNVTEPQAVRKLAGYEKVFLHAGQTRTVSVRVDAQQLRYWDTRTGSWRMATGTRGVWVGGSSRDLPLHAATAVSAR